MTSASSIDPPDGSAAKPITKTIIKRRGASIAGSRGLDVEVRR